MADISIREIADDYIYEWIRESIVNGKQFPDFRDGLKDSTRSIITEVGRMADFKRGPVPAETLAGSISKYREGAVANVEKNLYRLANGNFPLIRVTAEDNKGVIPGLNRMTGGYSMSRYLKIALTPLGVYAFKYRNYFKKTLTDTGSGIEKYISIDSPLPLGLLGAYSNLGDGFSNKAPNLNLVEVIDAYIEHLDKDKNTTTEDLVKHIKGFEITNGTTILTSNQALHDLIERGIMKAVTLAPIKIYKSEILITELPFKQFGTSIMKDINKIVEAGFQNFENGFKTFKVTGILPENSDEAFITISYELRDGYTIDDVREELYLRTKLKERIVYENYVLDHNSDKPLKVMSIRDILDYHVDLGIELKTREVKDKLYDLEKSKDEAIFLEKVTRKTVSAVIGKMINWHDQLKYTHIYLPKLNKLFKDIYRGTVDIENADSLGDFNRVYYVLVEEFKRLKELTVERFGELNEDNYLQVIDQEIPEDFSERDLNRVWNKEYLILYDLSHRDKAIQMLKTFEEKLAGLQAKLELDNIKKELKAELLKLRASYEGQSYSTTLYALKEQEREYRKQVKRKLNKAVKDLAKEIPINVWVDADYNAYATYSLTDPIPEAKYLFEGTTRDKLIVINKVGQSISVPFDELTREPTKLGSPGNILQILLDAPPDYYNLFLTNRGRTSLVTSKAFKFSGRTLDVALADGEHFVYSETIPATLKSPQISLVAITEDGLFKRRLLSDYVVKGTLGEFFNMFSGPSTCDNVIHGFINASVDQSIQLWNGDIKMEHTKGGFKRNVSKGEPLDMEVKDKVYIGDKLPIALGRAITDLNAITGDAQYGMYSPLLVNNLSEIKSPLTEIADFSEITWVKRFTSHNRNNFKLDVGLNEAQLKLIMSHLK